MHQVSCSTLCSRCKQRGRFPEVLERAFFSRCSIQRGYGWIAVFAPITHGCGRLSFRIKIKLWSLRSFFSTRFVWLKTEVKELVLQYKDVRLAENLI